MSASSTVCSRMLEAVREKVTGGIPVDGVVLEYERMMELNE
jgi:hypothetical protein